MEKLSLYRNYLPNCTIGRIIGVDFPLLNTIELPWNSNTPWTSEHPETASCICPGLYTVRPLDDKRYYLENPNLGVTLHGPSIRTEILIHIGNFVWDVKGCIAPGMGINKDVYGVTKSADAMECIHQWVKKHNLDQFLLEIMV